MKLGDISRVVDDFDRLFELLLVLGFVALAGLWKVESQLGVITQADAIAYPLAMVLLLVCLLVSRVFKQRKAARSVFFVFMSGYLITQTVLSVTMLGVTGSIYSAGTILQWLPLLYIVAFLTLPAKQAAYAALGVYVFMLGLMVAVENGFLGRVEPQISGLILNAVLSHAVYLFAMFGLIKLRQSTFDSEFRARRMERAANLDGLLNIANRRHIEQQMSALDSESGDYAILLIDIDHFKSINDTYGHMAGDQVLRELVKSIKGLLGRHDFLGRWGGEEFVVLAKSRGLAEGIQLAETLRSEVESSRFSFVNAITVSIGVADGNDSRNAKATFEQADMALYKAKEDGRNCVVIA